MGHEPLVEVARQVGRGGTREAGAGAFVQPPGQRELADDERVAARIEQAAVHAASVVGKDAQAGHAVGQPGTGRIVVAGDDDAAGAWLADRVARLRVFPDDAGRMNRSLLDTGGDALVVSQFTLAGRLDKGTRPSFTRAAAPDLARDLYERFVAHLQIILGRAVPTGRFAAAMTVHMEGDGPVTLWLER